MTAVLPAGPAKASFPVYLVDDHDEVYSHWKELGLRDTTLLHLDEHSDFQWIPENLGEIMRCSSFKEFKRALVKEARWKIQHRIHREMHLGNYLHRVFQEGMVNEWLWGVPDPLWHHAKLRRGLWKILTDLYDGRLGEMDTPRSILEGFTTRIMGAETTVTGFSELLANLSFPKERPVVLNIDLDFLTFQPHFSAPPPPSIYRRQIPWIWPEELCEKLFGLDLNIECAAVAHSVNGGFTPIGYKFLGEVLAARLRGEPLPMGYEKLKQALLCRHQRKDQDALEILNSFEAEGAVETARLYQRSIIRYELGHENAAQRDYEKCIERDPEFLSVYNSFAPLYEGWRSSRSAFEEYRMLKVLTPQSSEPVLGEARVYQASGKVGRAKSIYENFLAQNPDTSLLHPFASLAQIYMNKNRNAEALPLFEKAVRLSPEEPWLRVCLGECLYRRKRLEDAKMEIREALRLGYHFPVTYRILSQIYWKLGKRRKSLELALEFFRLIFLSWRKKWRS